MLAVVVLLDMFVLRPANARTAKRILDAQRDADDAAWSERVRQDANAVIRHNASNFPTNQ
jgi:hypothetical protein